MGEILISFLTQLTTLSIRDRFDGGNQPLGLDLFMNLAGRYLVFRLRLFRLVASLLFSFSTIIWLLCAKLAAQTTTQPRLYKTTTEMPVVFEPGSSFTSIS